MEGEREGGKNWREGNSFHYSKTAELSTDMRDHEDKGNAHVELVISSG